MRKKTADTLYRETISRAGLRLTQQRRHVFDALMGQRDHPTAVEVFMRVKENIPTISLATVYNCLETLTACGLVKHVNLERQSARYCPNLADHGHFFCDDCGAVFDVPLKDEQKLEEMLELPRNARVDQHSVTLRGLCPACATKQTQKIKKNRL